MPHRLHIRWRKQLPPLPLAVRLALLAVGWLLIALGVAGLFLPVLQGGLFLLAGAALVSLVSQRVHRRLRGLFARWPRGWRSLEKFRRWAHRKLHRG